MLVDDNSVDKVEKVLRFFLQNNVINEKKRFITISNIVLIPEKGKEKLNYWKHCS